MQKSWVILCSCLLTPFVSAQVQVNEICATNADIIYDPQFFNFSDWIELHNTYNSTANVGGYYLSDDPNNPFKWMIPSNTSIAAKGLLLIWCDEMNAGLHTNFSLDPKGEVLLLTNASGKLVESINYPAQFINMSYSRLTTATFEWRISPRVTPGSVNINGPMGGRLDSPGFSKASGRYQGAVTVELTQNKSGAEIRYTTNGSEPKESSPKYTGPIQLSSTKILKAAVYHPDFLPSETVTHTYLVNEHASALPVVSISTTPEYLWDNQIGIYAGGTNGIPGNCNGNPVNWNQDWDRHAVFEYLSPEGASLLSQHLEIRIGGNCSRNFPQKSLVLKARNKFGKNEIAYPFFKSKKKVDEFGGLFLRNAGNDFNTVMFRDAFIQSLGLGNMDIDYMEYQPTAFYLNGQYWGIQNLREKIDGDFIKSNYGIDKKDVDLLETYENAIEGDAGAWQTYKNTLQLMNPNDPNTFNFINSHIDVQEYINYLVTEIYTCNTDWPGNNVKFWRQRSTNGRFRWILWDTDFGFGLYPNQSYPTHPTLNFVTDPNQSTWPNPAFSTLHIRLVLSNPEFRNRFISTFSTLIGSTFHPENVNKKLSEFSARIESEVPYHKARWWGNVNDWYYELQRLRDFSASRFSFMQNHLSDFFGLGNPVQFTVNTLPPNSGKVDLNGILIESMDKAPYYKNVSFKAKAIPNSGFRFKDWSITTRDNEFISIASTGSTWKYFDQGSLPSVNWSSSSFNDSGWQEGGSQLGYGDNDEATQVGFGPDSNNKFITTYFRRTFAISDLTDLNDINASILFDDGAVVYLNGMEVFRNNLPAGPIDYNTLAQSAAPENLPISFTISKDLLISGTNLLAVEIHQAGPTSSDISFDFVASTTRTGNSVTYTLDELEIQDTVYSDVILTVNYEAIPSIDGLVLNEFSASKSFATDNEGETEDWIELFNSGIQPIDLTGVMITDDLSSKSKHILTNNGLPWLLPPGAYQILWADDQPGQGKEHLPFKLSNDGEELGIYHASGYDTTIIAELEFGPPLEGFSLARIPNGTGEFLMTSMLTPGSENMYNEVPTSFYPNPVDGELKVIVTDTTEVTIYNSHGSLQNGYSVNPLQEAIIDTRNYSNGVYFVRLSSPKIQSIKRLIVFHKD